MHLTYDVCDGCGFKQDGSFNGRKVEGPKAEEKTATPDVKDPPRDFYTIGVVYEKGVSVNLTYRDYGPRAESRAVNLCDVCMIESKIIDKVSAAKVPEAPPVTVIDLIHDIAYAAAEEAISNNRQ